MKKIKHSLQKGLTVLALSILGCCNLFGQGLACQDHINANLNSSCTADLSSIVIAAGANAMAIKDGNLTIITNTPNVYGTDPSKGGVTVGKIYIYELIDLSNNKCWGTIKFIIGLTIPPDVTVNCNQNYGFSTTPIEIVDTPTAASGQITRTDYSALASSSLQLPSSIFSCQSNFRIFYTDYTVSQCTNLNTVVFTRSFKPLSGPTTPSSPTFPNGASYIEHTITVRQYDGPITVPNDLTLSSLGGFFNTADYSPAVLSTSLLSNVKNEAYPKPILNADCVFTNSYNDIVTNTPNGKLITRFWQVKNCGGSNLNLQANAQGSVAQRIYVNNTMNSCATTLTLSSKMSNPIVVISAPVSCKLAVKSNFNAIQSMKFTINYDPSLLDFVNIQAAGLNITNSNYNNSTSGKISFVWTSTTPISLANDAEIFQLNFTRKSLSFLRNNVIYITGDVVPIEVINQNSDCVNVAFDACSPDFTQTYNTSICPSSVDLSNFIPTALKTPNRTFTYHDISNGATLSSSIVSPITNAVYYIKSLTSEGCMDETSVSITIKSVTACSSPSISNQGGPVIVNPCTCFGNKLFAEGIVILSLPNQIWTVQNTTFLNMNTGLPFPPGTAFTELPGAVNNQGYVRYSLVGYHKDAAGYIINAVSPTFPNLVLSQSNFCFSTH